MTEAEQLERERKWVATRFNCTVENMFDELSTVIQFDIREFNKLSGGREAKITNLEDGTVTFSRNERVASISVKRGVIKVTVKHRDSTITDFEVRPEWNEDTMFCDLFIGDEKVSTHRASQKIIGDVLFS